MASKVSSSFTAVPMSEDLLAAARRRIVDNCVKKIVIPPSDLDTLSERLTGVLRGTNMDLARGGAGTALGTAVGLKTGFAFLGTAVSGAWVLAPLFGLAFIVAGQALDE